MHLGQHWEITVLFYEGRTVDQIMLIALKSIEQLLIFTIR
jgi:hypothetical protein